MENVAGGEIRGENGEDFGLSSIIKRRRPPKEKAALGSW